MAKKKRIRKLLAKPFIALKEAIRRKWWPTDQERMAKVIPDWEMISELRNDIGIVYSGDVCAPKSKGGQFDIEKAKELHGMPVPTDMDPYILARSEDGHHVKIKSTDCLKREIKSKKIVWGPDDQLEVKECHQPTLRHTPEEIDSHKVKKFQARDRFEEPPSEPYPDVD